MRTAITEKCIPATTRSRKRGLSRSSVEPEDHEQDANDEGCELPQGSTRIPMTSLSSTSRLPSAATKQLTDSVMDLKVTVNAIKQTLNTLDNEKHPELAEQVERLDIRMEGIDDELEVHTNQFNSLIASMKQMDQDLTTYQSEIQALREEFRQHVNECRGGVAVGEIEGRNQTKARGVKAQKGENKRDTPLNLYILNIIAPEFRLLGLLQVNGH
ncbi:hypothetical protein M422DRAFT_51038 [Sphaerobolus stellatus SS14]|uniref:Uncharacterized protein n=1 Tax=Sphaerobolus stellatus (strain SS14) TaxID=990650 RepID=A0A0C9VG20_SPHS4|nr:hypothetical protein M422DRAFT_51038 [Sphaerobolus stellatus SS14]